jgi:hypothetical protein
MHLSTGQHNPQKQLSKTLCALWVPRQWIASSRQEWDRAPARIKCGYCASVDASKARAAK